MQPYADGCIKSITLSKNITPPVPEFVESPFDGRLARVCKNAVPTDKEEIKRKSLSRTRDKITTYAHNMIPEWFGTLTFSADKVDRYNMDVCRNTATRWLKKIRERKCPDMMYLLVPEQHKDGAWHFHILLSHVDGIEFVDSGHKSGIHTIYNCADWRYGFSNFTRVQDAQKTASYMAKYITKDLCDLSGRQRYLVSKNIPVYEPYVVNHTQMTAEELLVDFVGEVETVYCREYDIAQMIGIDEEYTARIAYHQRNEV